METNSKTYLFFYAAKFKSYYVVWKPTIHDMVEICVCGLNRTMQYGNQEEVKRKGKIVLSLNRTMQYGNSSFLLPSSKNT